MLWYRLGLAQCRNEQKLPARVRARLSTWFMMVERQVVVDAVRERQVTRVRGIRQHGPAGPMGGPHTGLSRTTTSTLQAKYSISLPHIRFAV